MNDNNKVDDDVSFMVVNDVSGDEDPHYIHTNDGDDCGGGGGGGDAPQQQPSQQEREPQQDRADSFAAGGGDDTDSILLLPNRKTSPTTRLPSTTITWQTGTISIITIKIV
eukprot:CAMPEP_0170985672 /NCGR_PEP_ID=MMETSP0736-20130129/5628_1 /TAXON_ID=186038 /ORGANISM="Fragilariopsis kerguelensis, Strain L26-C5" /LENGTH=110 /DNA_ID=CAMNT_0011409665 /DNA_START=773 /DNA_END=1106 /DNA_ORIENTATION=-